MASGAARMTLPVSAVRPISIAARPLRARAWWCMRQLVCFNLTDLLSIVATGQEADATDNLRQYLAALEAAAVITRINPHRGAPLWRLARDIGPLPPVWQRRQRCVLDPNSNTVIHLPSPSITAEVQS
jgi:hypothetical protein